METESSPPSGGSVQNPAPAGNEDQSRERVSGSNVMEMEGDVVGFDQNKLRLSKILDQIHSKASSVIEFVLQWEKVEENFTSMGDLIKERALEVELKEKSVMERTVELEKKEEIFEAEQKAKAKEMELKSKFLELKEKKLEEREKELELKQIELQERSIQTKTCKRPMAKLLAEKGSEADSLIHPAKKEKSNSYDDEDKEKDLACEVSYAACIFEHIKEGEIDEVVSIGDTDEDIEQVDCVDSEFHDFKKTISSFVVGQVWALYDPKDDMPRLYAQIKRVSKSDLSFRVTWIEPRDEESIPVACGRFKYGSKETIKSHLVFSHEMHPIKHGRKISVNPRKGETWALFRDWSKSWNTNSEQHKPPYRYDLVEVLLNFEDHLGVGVTYLGKVKGFISVFKHTAQHGVVSFVITPEEMYRFSHRVPSFRMNGDEKEGAPAGSFELDPAAIPSSLLNPDLSINEEAEETVRQSEDCCIAGEVEDQNGSSKDIPVTIILD